MWQTTRTPGTRVSITIGATKYFGNVVSDIEGTPFINVRIDGHGVSSQHFSKVRLLTPAEASHMGGINGMREVE